MIFLSNLGRFAWVFLPAAVLANMAYAAFFGQGDVAPEWRLGGNPIRWFIMTAPWVLPAVLAVPILHLLGRGLSRRHSARVTRVIVTASAPLLFESILVGFWGASYLAPGQALPTAAAAIMYGYLMRRSPSPPQPQDGT